MITATLNDQNHISKNSIGSVIDFFILTEVTFVYMERAGFITCTAASHQGAITEPAASLSRTSETHPLWTGAECACVCVCAVRCGDKRAPGGETRPLFFHNGKHIYTESFTVLYIVHCVLFTVQKILIL